MTTPAPWTAERTTDAARAARLVAAAVPALAGRPVTPLAQGWDNTVLRVAAAAGDADGRDWAFRFPRRAVALPGVRREVAVLPAVAPLLPLPVPVPRVVGSDDDPADPWPFTGARLLEGTELAEAALPAAARCAVAAALGGFLAALHSPAVRGAAVDAAAAAGAPLPVDPMERGWPRPRRDRVLASLDALAAEGAWAGADGGADAVRALLAEAARLDAPTGRPVLVHGDLHVRHVLVDGGDGGDGDGAVAGVIDLGDACLADPAVDLGIAHAAFEGEARAALLEAYRAGGGVVDGERELRARAVAVRISALLATSAAAEGRTALLAEACAGLERAVR